LASPTQAPAFDVSEKGRPCRAVAKRLQTNAGFEWLRLELHAFLRDGEML
jgi:hypothetical protein